MSTPTPLSGLLLLLLALAAVSRVTGSAYDDSKEEEENTDNGIPLIPSEKRASNLGSRMCQNCGAFNLGKKFVGYHWLRSMESRQRRAPYYVTNNRPHNNNKEETRDDDVYWVKSYRY